MKLIIHIDSVMLFKKVHEKQNEGSPWNRAMDEVHVERLIENYKDGGELCREDPALLMLKKWPVSRKYYDNPEKLPGLEQLVCVHRFSRKNVLVFSSSTQLVYKISSRSLDFCY